MRPQPKTLSLASTVCADARHWEVRWSVKADDPCHGALRRRLAAAFPEIAPRRRGDMISMNALKRNQMMR